MPRKGRSPTASRAAGRQGRWGTPTGLASTRVGPFGARTPAAARCRLARRSARPTAPSLRAASGDASPCDASRPFPSAASSPKRRNIDRPSNTHDPIARMVSPLSHRTRVRNLAWASGVEEPDSDSEGTPSLFILFSIVAASKPARGEPAVKSLVGAGLFQTEKAGWYAARRVGTRLRRAHPWQLVTIRLYHNYSNPATDPWFRRGVPRRTTPDGQSVRGAAPPPSCLAAISYCLGQATWPGFRTKVSRSAKRTLHMADLRPGGCVA